MKGLGGSMKKEIIIALCSVCCRAYRSSGTRLLKRTKSKKRTRCTECLAKTGFSYYCEPVGKNGGRYD
jgi:hypothetical protein